MTRGGRPARLGRSERSCGRPAAPFGF